MEAGWFKLDLYRGLFCLLSIIIFLGLSRWNITDGLEQTLMVESIKLVTLPLRWREPLSFSDRF